MKKRIKLPNLVSDFRVEEKMILRDHLAILRTRLSNERTLFAYIQTSLYLFLGGVAFTEIGEFYSVMWLGYASLILSVLIIAFGLLRFFILRRKLDFFYGDHQMPEKIQ